MQSLYRNILNKFMFNYLRLYISDSLDVSSTLLYMYFELMCLSFYLSLGILDNVQFVWIDMKWLKDLILNKFLSKRMSSFNFVNASPKLIAALISTKLMSQLAFIREISSHQDWSSLDKIEWCK